MKTLDGSISDWAPSDRLDLRNQVAGHALYGEVTSSLFSFALAVPAGTAIGANTTIWLDTDFSPATGYQVFGSSVGAEYNINFDSTGTPHLYTGGAGETLVAGNVDFAYNADHSAVEFNLARAAIGNVDSARLFVDVNDQTFIPQSYSSPGFVIGASKGTAIGKVVGSVTLDGALGDWTTADRIGQVVDATGTYDVFARATGGSYVFALHAPVAIGEGTTAWLNTDRDATTGYKIFGFAGGAEFNVNFDAKGNASLYTGAAGQTLVLANLDTAYSADHSVVEFSVPKAALGNPNAIDTLYDVNDTTYLPGSYSGTPYTVYDSSVVRTDHTKRVGIVYSDTTANQYFSKTAYSQLFANAQSEATAAGVTYDLLTESDLKDLTKLSNYDTLIFPSFRNVQASDVTAITNTLAQATKQFGIGLIAAGDFMTNDATGAALPGDSYAREKLLFDATRTGGTFPADVDLRSIDTNHLVLDNYNSGDLIHSYKAVGYNSIVGVTNPGTALVTQTVNGTDVSTAALATQTGGRNVLFSTESVAADSHLLSQAIDYSVNGSGISVGLQITRNTGVLASRTDLDQSQELDDVKPADGSPGIYAKLLPILQQWKADYNFVGSYYANIGNDPTTNKGPDWTVLGPFYKSLVDMGNEVGTHSYTHPEDTNVLTAAQTEFEFNQSKAVLEKNISAALGRPYTIDGAAVPGAPETLATATAISQYFSYISGGFSGVGAGYPGAIGYLTPGLEAQNKVYIAPNATFDYTLVEFQHKSIADTEAYWAQEWSSLTAHAKTPIVVWPWHDYGPTQWSLDPGVASPYTLQMYTDYIARAAAAGFEFVTLDDLAQRTASFDNSGVTSTVSGNVVTATVASASAGHFALDVSGQGSQVIQNVAGWYAYDAKNVFLPKNGGTFTITLGTVADDVTHITSLPLRSDLQSLTGDGTNLAFSVIGEGTVTIDLKNPATSFLSITGATTKSLTGDILTLDLGAIGPHDVAVKLIADTAPVITSNGGGATAAVSIYENTTSVLTAAATDANSALGDTVKYSLSGADAPLFVIDAATGVLAFKAAPDFETPIDASHHNIYAVNIVATDSKGLSGTQSLAVSVLDNINHAPVITSNGGGDVAAISIAELLTKAVTTVQASDADVAGEGDRLSYSLGAGKDSSAFVIDAATGALSFKTLPSFNLPTDSDHNNSYIVDVIATDLHGASDTQTITALVAGSNVAPIITSGGAGASAVYSINENSTSVATIVATDADVIHGDKVTYGITSGTDAALFQIDPVTGAISFKAAPDFELPTDSNHDNIYNVDVQSIDSHGLFDSQSLAITVKNVLGVTLAGTSRDDIINGTGEEDRLSGGAGNDTINGGGGNDVIIGAAGADRLTGGAGNDIFRYQQASESGPGATHRDIITDFKQGEDKIDLSNIDANTSFFAFGNQSFSLLPTAGQSFSATGQLKFSYQTIGGVEHTIIEGDTNIFRITDFSIDLMGHVALKPTDFVL